jgi:hypothetical protein
MPYGGFGEGKAQQAGKDWEVLLPEDDPESVRVILLAVHGRLPDIPSLLDRVTLFRVVVACDKYDMVELLRPFWASWLGKLPYAHPVPETVIQRLWIAHKLGDRHTYLGMLEKLPVRSTIDKTVGSAKLFLEGSPSFDLYTDVHLQSFGIMREFT